MTDLAAWLLEQIQYDEDHARQAFADHNDDGPNWTEIWSGTLNLGTELVATNDAGVSRHMANWDPARVLAECDAKRRIIELADEASELDAQVDHEFRSDVRDMQKEPYVGDSILRQLASPYADRPGYQERWRPRNSA